MIGWWFIVSTQTPDEIDQADQINRRAAALAQWEIRADGIRWIEDLVQAGKATKLSGSGYPNRYTALAADVLPLISARYATPASLARLSLADDEYVPLWKQHKLIEWQVERIEACPPEKLLTIVVWDLS
ncbi:hypothetical protein [Hydrogenophaga atypica]|uniref:Uncharacterized protein n=1 Tax=Hydrogenophaga atypica TaxID=249409 RepID=A0ABW2QQ25_9BURK